ncbi:MAG: hypothetical protein AB4041_15985 [Microcystaceae cyanobacterium]
MMNPTQWAGLGVQDFFNGFNWKGDPPKLPPMAVNEEIEQESLNTEDLVSLTLQDFLRRGNWQGMTLSRHRSSVVTAAAQPQASFDPVLSLKLPVHRFFKGIPWQGGGLMPAAKSASPKKKNSLAEAIPEPSDDWTITDLSDLL